MLTVTMTRQCNTKHRCKHINVNVGSLFIREWLNVATSLSVVTTCLDINLIHYSKDCEVGHLLKDIDERITLYIIGGPPFSVFSWTIRFLVVKEDKCLTCMLKMNLERNVSKLRSDTTGKQPKFKINWGKNMVYLADTLR